MVSKKGLLSSVAVVAMAGVALAACVAECLTGCEPARSPVDVGDSGADPADFPDPAGAANPDCARACRAILAWGCPEAAHPDGGDGCYALCSRKQQGGHFTLQPACLAAAASPDDARTRCRRADGSPVLRCQGR